MPLATYLPPTKQYNGLTVVLSQPSRKDIDYIISGYAGIQFEEFLGQAGTTRENCEIRLATETNRSLLQGTRKIILLGEPALHQWCPAYKDYTLNELRGTPLQHSSGLPCIASYTPQDACDLQDYESKYNEYLMGEEGEDEDEKEDVDGLKKRGGKTRRANYRFWLQSDIRKILWPHERYSNDQYILKLYPKHEEIIEALNSNRNTFLYFDIETDSEHNLTVIGFSFEDSNEVFSFPVLDYNYRLYYGNHTFLILRALVNAIVCNTVVIHNSMFDLFILLWKYRLIIGRRIWDTMLVMARMFPEVEKSLGHVLSYHPEIWEKYHKDGGVFEPKNSSQEFGLLKYNAQDVIALRLIHRAQSAAIANNPGLQASVKQANSAPYSFLINTCFGFKVDEEAIKLKLKENDDMLNHYLRVVKILTGIELNPNSAQQCIKYFHGLMGYPPVGRTKEGAPSLKKDNIYKLKLKQPQNIVIDFTIKYRTLVKQSGSLKAQPLPEHISNGNKV